MTRDTYTAEPFLRIGEAARQLGVSVDTMRRWDKEGRLKARRRGGQRVYAPSDLVGVVSPPDDEPVSA